MSQEWLEQSIIVLTGIGEKMLQRFARRSLFTLNDLLFHLPVRYQDKTRIVPIARLRVGDHYLVKGELIDCHIQQGKRAVLSCTIDDGTSVLNLRFFHFNQRQVTGLKKALEQGKWLTCFGEAKYGRQTLEIIHPEYRIINKNQLIQMDESLTPVYPTTEGLSQLVLLNAIQQVIEKLQQNTQKPDAEPSAHADKPLAHAKEPSASDKEPSANKKPSRAGLIEDFFPHSMRQELNFPTLSEALIYLHAPPPDCSVFELMEGHDPYRGRLVFEELLAHQLSMKSAYQKHQQYYAFALRTPARTVKKHYSAQFLQQLSFKLTQAQQTVVDEIALDVQKNQPMQRLVQGDVGSGKTVVAALAALFAMENGFQAALMAPTELLAEQHRINFQQWLQALDLKVGWLSGKSTAKQRRESLAQIADGSVQMIIGTHALFQESVIFKRLGLVIIDEQHRFGVHQRLALLQKGENKAIAVNQEDEKISFYPHQLIMTATPIPRTLAMTAYADLDCSVIDELPPGRTPVETVVLSEQRRNDVLHRVHNACLNKRQAYWVCTLIEESEVLQCQAAEKTHAMLLSQFPDIAIGLVHGRMKTAEKQAVMQSFKQGDISMLVATTVIEVGVDVPNASLMIIENAERLGLSQLHQLRGRVGRGTQSSVCVLMYSHPLSKNGKSRLMTLRETNDGFEVARKDLALRGPGELLGTRQTGLAEMKIADIIRDQQLIPKVNDIAQRLMDEYPQSVTPIINRWIGQKAQYQNV